MYISHKAYTCFNDVHFNIDHRIYAKYTMIFAYEIMFCFIYLCIVKAILEK